MTFMPHRERIQLEHEGRLLDVQIVLATGFWSRLRGLMGVKALPAGVGMLLAPCNSIHMLGMRQRIEAVFISKDFRVLKVSGPLKPWCGLSACRKAWGVIEWAPGQAGLLGLREGVQLKRVTVEARP